MELASFRKFEYSAPSMQSGKKTYYESSKVIPDAPRSARSPDVGEHLKPEVARDEGQA